MDTFIMITSIGLATRFRQINQRLQEMKNEVKQNIELHFCGRSDGNASRMTFTFRRLVNFFQIISLSFVLNVTSSPHACAKYFLIDLRAKQFILTSQWMNLYGPKSDITTYCYVNLSNKSIKTWPNWPYCAAPTICTSYAFSYSTFLSKIDFI